MAEAGFTKGPWEVGYLDRNSQRVVKSEHIEIATCWHHSVGSIEQEMEANARLIAASPTMLDALLIAEYAISEWRKSAGELRGVDCEGLIYARKIIRAALLKATGAPAHG